MKQNWLFSQLALTEVQKSNKSKHPTQNINMNDNKINKEIKKSKKERATATITTKIFILFKKQRSFLESRFNSRMKFPKTKKYHPYLVTGRLPTTSWSDTHHTMTNKHSFVKLNRLFHHTWDVLLVQNQI